jgi:hypothetical protein
MPDQPAKSIFGFSWGSGEKQAERLATPEELAEYGALGPDPETEAKILALFEEQLLQDLIKEIPPQPVVPGSPAAATEIALTETPVNVNEPAEARKPELVMQSAMQEIALKPAANRIPSPIQTLVEVATGPTQVSIAVPVEVPHQPSPADVAAAKALLEDDIAAEPVAAVEETGIAEEVVSEREAAEVLPRPVGTGDLLEFAEVLDQHRLWVESGGKEGAQGHFAGADLTGVDLTAANLQGAELQKANLRGADLSMANLRNANLVEADLRETNLLGT